MENSKSKLSISLIHILISLALIVNTFSAKFKQEKIEPVESRLDEKNLPFNPSSDKNLNLKIRITCSVFRISHPSIIEICHTHLLLIYSVDCIDLQKWLNNLLLIWLETRVAPAEMEFITAGLCEAPPTSAPPSTPPSAPPSAPSSTPPYSLPSTPLSPFFRPSLTSLACICASNSLCSNS
jgi:hypothetical protein